MTTILIISSIIRITIITIIIAIIITIIIAISSIVNTDTYLSLSR